MKKLFSRTKKPARNWEAWEDGNSDEYDWDRAEDADAVPEEGESPDAEDEDIFYGGEYAEGEQYDEGEGQPALTESGEAAYGWQEDGMAEPAGAGERYYAPEREPAGHVWEESVYDGQEEADDGYYGQVDGYARQEEAGDRYYGQEKPETVYRETVEAEWYHGQGKTGVRVYEREKAEDVYHGLGAETEIGWQEEPEAIYYGQEELEAGYPAQEEPEAVYYGQEEPESPYHGQKREPEIVYYGQEEPETAYHGQEEPEIAYHGQEEPEIAYHGQEEPEAAYYEPETNHGPETPETAYYGQQEEFYGEGEEYAGPPVRKKQARRPAQEYKAEPEAGFLARFLDGIRRMDLMDKVMLVTGAGVLILAVVTVGVFASRRIVKNQVADFANVGLQLDGITVIGERGLMAVADAELTRLAAISAAEPPEPGEPDVPKNDYNEIGYDRQVSVEPGFTSIQKDLKIKFINTKTDKLVPNVPFSVTVTGPDGKTLIWSDDDMDGIIYKKDITPGTYQVAMETLTDTRYAGYTISTSVRSVEVKKEIAYNKVDVANEVKKESEVNAAKEDTRKNETVVESTLQDTVAWVESKTVVSTYSEVAKSTIPDPATRITAKAFRQAGGVQLLSQDHTDTQPDGTSQAQPDTQPESASHTQPEASLRTQPDGTSQTSPDTQPDETSQTPPDTQPEDTAQPPAETPTEVPPEAPTAEPTQIPTEAPTQLPTAEPTQLPTEAPTPVVTPTPVPTPLPSPTPMVTPVPVRGSISVDHTNLSGGTGAVLTAKATASGFDPGRAVYYSVQTNNPAVATATVDLNGSITVYTVAVGTAVLTVTANCEGGGAETAASADISVSVGGGITLSLDASAVTASVQVPVTIHAAIANSVVQEPVVGAESSDTTVAVVSVDKKAVTITGVAEGSAVITVKYTENGVQASASCTVTVKGNPREDRTTLLKDADGRQLYVLENNTYREAVYADYYVAEKFFIKGEAKYTGWQTIDGRLYYFTAEGNKVTGEQVIQGAKYHFASDGSLVTGDGTLGIDVSKWNGTIDWNAVKNSGVSYVIIRCGYRGSSEGKLIEDPKYEANIKGATAAGLKVGVYFFTQAVNEIEAVEEASMVLEQIRNYRISYPVFLDVEPSGGRGDGLDKAARTAVCRAFCQTVQNAGYTAGIYANKQWLEGKLDAGSLGNFKIWLAQYAAAPTYTGRYDMWQYKAKGSISGISGDVDLNISYLGY